MDDKQNIDAYLKALEKQNEELDKAYKSWKLFTSALVVQVLAAVGILILLS